MVIARECSAEDTAEICRNCPAEVEVFVHGALCMCYSGQCYLSSAIGGRSGNRGRCAQPCRQCYGYSRRENRYPLSLKDNCLVGYLQELDQMGVACIKLEGRAKSEYYAAIVTGAYRHVLDAVAGGLPVDPVWRDEVEKVSHRRYSTGFFYGEPGQYVENSRYVREYQICAVVTGRTPDGLAVMSLRNKFSAGDELELVGPDLRPVAFTAPEMQLPDGTPLREPRTPQMEFLMQLPCPVPALSIVRRQVDLAAKD